MKVTELKCKACGGSLKVSPDRPNQGVCEYCKTECYIESEPRRFSAPPIQRSLVSKAPLAAAVILMLFFMLSATLSGIGRKAYYKTDQKTVAIMEPPAEPLPEMPGAVWQEFLDHVFGKPADQVTAKELESIETFAVRQKIGGYYVTYSIGEGPEQSVILDQAENLQWKDFGKLTGLRTLDLGYDWIEPGSLDGMTMLEEFSSDLMPLEKMIEMIAYPEQIKSLTIRTKAVGESGLQGIEVFSNLEKLTLSGIEIPDLKPLAANPRLTVLIIDNYDEAVDFSALYVLTQLKELRIRSKALKEIGFAEQMEELEVFEIEGSTIITLEPLRGKLTLTELSVTRNSDLEDYSAIQTLHNLKKLEIAKITSKADPDLSELYQLEELSISGFTGIGFLSQMSQLASLDISGCHIDRPGAFAGLVNLKRLTCKSFWGEIPNLRFISTLPSLEYLNMTGVSLYGDISEVFHMPVLETLILSDGEFELDFSRLSQNHQLKELRFNQVKLYQNVKVQTDGFISSIDYDTVLLDENTGFLVNYPGLERLSLTDNKLTNINFAAQLPALKELDISSNYVTELRPLEHLEYLEEVICRDNPIVNKEILSERVLVITE